MQEVRRKRLLALHEEGLETARNYGCLIQSLFPYLMSVG
jgi:hypothetical protein